MFKNNPNANANGTSFHGTTFNSTIGKLKEAIGEPSWESRDRSEKVQVDWTFESDHGEVFTIYDWKSGYSLSDDDLVEFHIGSHNSTSDQLEEQFLEWIKSKLQLLSA